MACTDCSDLSELDPCSCEDGHSSYTISTSNTTIANPMTIAVSNVSPYTGAFAKIGSHIFIEGYGYYAVTASTATSITVAFPITPFVGGATFAANTVDYDNSGTIPSGAKISGGGVKGATGASLANLINLGSTSAEMSTGSQVTNSTASFANLSVVTVLADTLATDKDALKIRAKYFYDKNTTTAGNIGYAKITMTEGANTVNLTQSLTSLGAVELGMDGGPFNAPNSNTGGPDFLDIEIIVSKNTATTCNFQLRVAPGLVDSYSAEEVYYIKNGEFTLEKTVVSTVTWANTVYINFTGKVVNASDEVKLGFYSVELLNKT